MSVDVSRHYLIPIERLADALSATAEIGPKSRTLRQIPIGLPDGSTVVLPFRPESEPPYRIGDGDGLSFVFAARVALDDEMEKFARANPEPEFEVKETRAGGKRTLIPLFMSVGIEPPYAEISFHNTCTRDAHLLGFKAVRDVLDYVGKCGDWIAVFDRVMGEETLVSPFKATIPPGDPGAEGADLARIAAFAARPNPGPPSMETSPR